MMNRIGECGWVVSSENWRRETTTLSCSALFSRLNKCPGQHGSENGDGDRRLVRSVTQSP